MFLQFGINDNGSENFTNKKLNLINELFSPLMRIMWLYNWDEPQRRTFENNISCFHIGNGLLLSVAHNLRIQAGYFRSIDVDLYRTEILSRLDGAQNRHMEQYYFTDDYTRKRYLSATDAVSLQNITNILRQKRFDTRWVSLANKGICRPHVILQFRKNTFYNSDSATHLFDPTMQFYDQDAHKYTFMLPVALVDAWYDADIALYRIVDTPAEIIEQIPSIEVNFDFLDEMTGNYYCLQSSPGGSGGRLLNRATIDGAIDHFGIFQDDVGGNYLFEGLRYLISGYFRFGSSGAPYLFYNAATGSFYANAVQSEASGVQLSINNDREGNFQYVNAIATPLHIIQQQLEKYMKIAIAGQ
jgi:hypothetical protein